MSYDRRGGGYRRRYRDDYDDRRRDAYETPEEKLKISIMKLGEVDPVEELPRLQKTVREYVPFSIQNVAEALRLGVTEQPYKIPFYAALILLLHNDPVDTAQPDGPSMGRQILEDIWKGFQAYLDKLSWREARLCVHLFAHLTVADVVSAESMTALLQSFVAVLDEFGVSYGRAKKAAICAAEGLMICGPVLKSASATIVADIINAIQAFNDGMLTTKSLVQPITSLFSESTTMDCGDEVLDAILYSLKTMNDSDFAETANCFPQPYITHPLEIPVPPFDLPSVLVPPEVIELDGLSTNSEEEAHIKKDEWPEYLLRIFDNDVSPDPSTPAGYVIRTALLDILNIFEVNRKECARLLLEYPKWNLPGTFKPKPGAPTEVEPVPGKDWQLESTIIETILGALLTLPESQQKSIYYISLITELCKLSPSTVGPAVGKSIRKLYGYLSEGLDVEASRRFAEWFAVHMSNFGFQWVWKEWVPDLVLAMHHPKRAFVRRAVEFEVRLSYHERILKTLPEPFQSPAALTISEQGPGPDYEYEDPSAPHHEAAMSILNLLRGRAKAEDVIAQLDTLRSTLEASEEGHVNLDAVVCSIVVQSLLSIGSRSFSHLLNAIERYLPLLRFISSGGASSTGGSGNPEARAGILSATAAFWKHSRQMISIVFDKLMQYQIVEPTDVIGWTFTNGAKLGQPSELTDIVGLTSFEWDLVRAALDKANGRVLIARRKVSALRKEDEDQRARAKASANEGTMDVDAEAKHDEPVADSPALTTALNASTTLVREQKTALSGALEGFISYLVPSPTQRVANPQTRSVITEHAWHNRANWEKDEWSAWETWGWYRQFCRIYAPYLRTYSNTLSTISFGKFEDSTDPAVELLRRIWNISTGQEA